METSQGIKTEFVEGLKIFREKASVTGRKQEVLNLGGGILFVYLQLVTDVSG